MKPGKQQHDLLIIPGPETRRTLLLAKEGVRVLGEGEDISRMKDRGHIRKTYYCFGVGDVNVLPLWVGGADDTQVKEAVSFQLQKRGLLPPHDKKAWDYSVITRSEDKKVLVTARILNEKEGEDYSGYKGVYFQVSVGIYDLPARSIVILKESGKLVAVFTGEKEPVYYQCMDEDTVSPFLGRSLFCIASDLEARRMIVSPEKILVSSGLGLDLGSFFSCPVAAIDTLGFKPLGDGSGLVPVTYERHLETREAARLKKRILGAAILAYILCLAVMGGLLANLWWQGKSIKKEITRDEVIVEKIKNAANQWRVLDTIVDTGKSPLEILYLATEMLPAEGVRLTTYQYTPGNIIMIGEAKNAGLAYQYGESLKQNAALKAYEWTLPQPRLLPTGAANFQMEGRRR
ncbi:MAG: hypothetical protein SGI98_09835 [Verrucomicrobiota bacterium]|nr:hypothetical protein [Verrucomicrobiota bacterium]